MGRNCIVCTHAERRVIDSLLASGRAKKRHLARDFDLSEASIYRHIRAGHVKNNSLQVNGQGESSRPDKLFQELTSTLDAAKDVFERALKASKRETAIRALREVRQCLELIAKLEGRLSVKQTTVTNVYNAPQVVQMRATILQALAPYPEARRAVSHALLELPELSGSSPTQTDEE